MTGREPEPSYEHGMVRIPEPEMADERGPEPEARAAETADERAGVGEEETDG